jgi:NAD-dependent deacetylase
MVTFSPALLGRLAGASRVAVLTGAGVSAESGVPTFRDAQTGLWARYNPHELATPEAFRANPRLVWEWYEFRRGLVAAARPNPGHVALAALEARYPDFTLATQNVDNLHRTAGSQNVVELHGNLAQTLCSAEMVPVAHWGATDEVPPRCPRCGSPLRPGVVWFGEALPPAALQAARAAAARAEVFLSVGTSGLVHPAAGLPLLAREGGAYVVAVNIAPGDPALFDEQLIGPAGVVLPALCDALGVPLRGESAGSPDQEIV